MTSIWDSYPSNYRQAEVNQILSASAAGECVSVVGLSGAGKSNLLGYIAHRIPGKVSDGQADFLLVDCTRLSSLTAPALFDLMLRSMDPQPEMENNLISLEEILGRRLESSKPLCFLLDRFEVLADPPNQEISGNLRVLRDRYKYQLSYVLATRRPLNADNELAELFFAHTIWLGSLSQADTIWTIKAYAARGARNWKETKIQMIAALSLGYPSFVRAICEAYASGAELETESLANHPAVQRRVAEFWQDEPTAEALEASGLSDHPLLQGPQKPGLETSKFTAQEHRLYDYLTAHPDQVCTKDDLIRAIWPEDKIYDEGIRDDSLAQVVRRLRVKIEANPSKPRLIHTIPGRGYLYKE